MQKFESEIFELLKQAHGITVTEEDIHAISDKVLYGHKEKLFAHEFDLCQSQRMECVTVIHKALDNYYHKGMELEEIKNLAAGVLAVKAKTPQNIADTVRLMLVR